jgi:predicted ATP-grasp superfamily ATP-dependent carboligase
MRAFGFLLIALFAVGCSGDATISAKDKSELKDNLNKPVDVDKIRAEYYKNKPAETGVQPAKDGM